MTARIVLLVASSAILASAAQAQFGSQTELVSPAGPADFEVLDLDGDGDNDLVVADASGQGLVTYANLGDGTFGPPQLLQNVGSLGFMGALELDVADIDGDGIVDVAAVSPVVEKLSWWRSNGDGTFGVEQTIATGIAGALEVIAADFDGDGDADLATSASDANSVDLHENLGGGLFAAPVPVLTGFFGPRGLAVGDMDGDGLADLVVCAEISEQVVRLRNLGNGGFVNQGPVSLGLGRQAKVVLSDYDGDGRLDVLASNPLQGWVTLTRNTSGGFAPAGVLFVHGGAFGLAAADFDYDGDPDVAVTGIGGGFVRTYENLGNQTFAAPIDHPGFKDFPWAVAFADIDGDQDLDLVTSARAAGKLFMNRNESTLGVVYCTGYPNSTGAAGTIAATGADDVSFERLSLTCESLPANVLGYFLVSGAFGSVDMPPGSQGLLCLGGTIGRFIGPGQAQSSGPGGRFSIQVDVNQIPQPPGFAVIQPGSTWNFQAWHRDSVGGSATSNFTQAVAVTF